MRLLQGLEALEAQGEEGRSKEAGGRKQKEVGRGKEEGGMGQGGEGLPMVGACLPTFNFFLSDT